VHDTDIHFTFVLEGTMTLRAKGQPDKDLSPGDAFVIPPGMAAQYADCSADLELLEATLPAGFTTTVTTL
jgi:quercetin dioxygenase-like cupin family protein